MAQYDHIIVAVGDWYDPSLARFNDNLGRKTPIPITNEYLDNMLEQA